MRSSGSLPIGLAASTRSAWHPGPTRSNWRYARSSSSQGAEVITQANTCVPTIAGIERAGAKPVLCDVEPAAGTMDPDSVVQAITERTAAIVPVHLYGQCGDMDAVREIAVEHEVVIIEDCAQAHGAEFKGRRAGTIGAMGCFSFYPTKNLGALGDAGAVVTGDDQLAARVRLVRQYGQTGRYSHQVAGVNSRMDEVQAAVLRVKLSQSIGATRGAVRSPPSTRTP